MNSKATLYLVDDDDEVRRTLARALKHNDYEVKTFNSGQAFLDKIDLHSYGCIILDVAMPGISGLEVQNELLIIECKIPIIFMTGHGDVPTSVRALKSGAVEFLEKPFHVDLLLQIVDEVLISERQRQENDDLAQGTVKRFASLTQREADVMICLVKGMADRSNKEVAREIGISFRTVEEYRARIMVKMNASSITHLVEMAKVCGVYRR